jgi:hypothetical protein
MRGVGDPQTWLLLEPRGAPFRGKNLYTTSEILPKESPPIGETTVISCSNVHDEVRMILARRPGCRDQVVTRRHLPVIERFLESC